MMKVRKIPQRMCSGCLEKKDKKDLIRVVKNKEGQISIDLTGKKPGRGAYICRNLTCLEKAIKAKKLDRSLEVKIDEETFVRLREEIGNE
ncbi:MAG: YlxR family protein [Bacillota bacterium]|nr:YlxR family protein [Bacillota bacterium]